MKDSEAYKIAQLAVLADDRIKPEEKLYILGLLMEAEVVSKFTEERDAQ